jgi:4a-hydroxytetrahydrobiopterin dehydratase
MAPTIVPQREHRGRRDRHEGRLLVCMTRRLTDEEIERQLADLTDWTRDGDTIRASFEAPAFLTGIALVDEVADAAETMDHHPDIDIRWRTVSFALSTHSEGGLTQLDVELAHRISDEAARRGAVASA